jgi:acetyl-CoA acetyltransferase
MRFENAYVPYGAYWSTPFCKWQGSLASVHAIVLAAQAGRQAFAARDIPADAIDGIVLGMTVPQKHALYGGPWLAAMLGAERVTGTLVSQACATGARSLATAAAEVEAARGGGTMLVVTADRCSNGPHIYYPNPAGPGGTGEKEDWVLDSFGHDPWARNAMIDTAENVAREHGISREEQDEVTALRYRQYQDALEGGAAFQRRYMLWPFEVTDARGKPLAKLEGDEGVFATTAEGLGKLKPVKPDGTVTFGSQTHPADGNCGLVVTTRERARALSRDAKLEVRILAYGQGRADKGFMAKATVPAARAALAAAGIEIGAVDVIKTHNPFAVNDVYLARELGVALEAFNNFGSSLIYGHPQAPTGTRLILETIEELAHRGGGTGLFVGCAAGDTAAAVVLRVDA